MKIMIELFKSKKFLAALAGAAVVVLNKAIGLELPEADVLKILGVIASYIVGQGIADHGKEKAKIENPSKVLAAMKSEPAVIERNAVRFQDPVLVADEAIFRAIDRNRKRLKKILDEQ